MEKPGSQARAVSSNVLWLHGTERPACQPGLSEVWGDGKTLGAPQSLNLQTHLSQAHPHWVDTVGRSSWSSSYHPRTLVFGVWHSFKEPCVRGYQMGSSPGSLPLVPLSLPFQEHVFPRPTASSGLPFSSKPQPSTQHYIFVLFLCLHYFLKIK